jgi:predicted nucleotidyltransferase
MPPKIKELESKNLAHPPTFLADSMQLEVQMGSFAYGVSNDTSDMDVYGFCIPDKVILFPHLAGHILGFGKKPQNFETYTEHHIYDASAMGGEGREYDYSIHSIVKYFQLCMDNNPNMVDSLFVPNRCIMHMTPIGQMVRDQRKLFLHKGCWHKFKGYAYQQLHKMRIKDPKADSKRRESVEKYGYDVKFGYHVVRLLNECEQILVEGDLDLERSREQLKSIRRGEWKLEDIEDYFKRNEPRLETIYAESKLPYGPPEDKIKSLLIQCLEQHFGTLDGIVVRQDPAIEAFREIEAIVNKYKGKI